MDARERVGCAEGWRLEQNGVDDAEDGGITANRNGQREDGDGGEARAVADQAHAVGGVQLQIACEAAQPSAALDGRALRRPPGAAAPRIAELLLGLGARECFGHAATHQFRGAHVEMKLELVADVGLDVGSGARGKAEQAAGAEGFHGATSGRIEDLENRVRIAPEGGDLGA
jgi:hypothetical protein